ncbi:hypothetical protein [Spirosoma panaciterrae]
MNRNTLFQLAVLALIQTNTLTPIQPPRSSRLQRPIYRQEFWGYAHHLG